MANVKITSYVDSVQREQDEATLASQREQDAITQGLHNRAMKEATKANERLDKGVAGAQGERGHLSRSLEDIAQPPPSTNPPTPKSLQLQIDWLNTHIVVLGESVLALVTGHATGPKEEEGAPPS